MNISTNKTLISLIVCVSNNGVIGNKGVMPWKNSEDMKFFKEKTTNYPVIMGRKTFESIGHPLKERFNIVITNDIKKHEFRTENPFGPVFVGSLVEAINIAEDLANEMFIIGGATIYDDAIRSDVVDRMYINVLKDNYEGDTKFPYYNENDWSIIKSEVEYKTFKSYTFFRKQL